MAGRFFADAGVGIGMGGAHWPGVDVPVAGGCTVADGCCVVAGCVVGAVCADSQGPAVNTAAAAINERKASWGREPVAVRRRRLWKTIP
jgi:hypothetical protein